MPSGHQTVIKESRPGVAKTEGDCVRIIRQSPLRGRDCRITLGWLVLGWLVILATWHSNEKPSHTNLTRTTGVILRWKKPPSPTKVANATEALEMRIQAPEPAHSEAGGPADLPETKAFLYPGVADRHTRRSSLWIATRYKKTARNFLAAVRLHSPRRIAFWTKLHRWHECASVR